MTNEQIWEATRVGEWLDAKFYDRECGEIFLVELRKGIGEEMEDFIVKCQEVADENFNHADFVELVDEEDVDILIYDTY